MKFLVSLLCLSLFILIACSSNQLLRKQKDNPISAAIKAHGGKRYDKAAYRFDFRKKSYTFKNNGGLYHYTVASEKDGKSYYDALNNDGFTREIDGELQNLSEKDALRFGNSLNSVIYFALLPYKLDDPAARKVNKGTITIKDKTYDVVEVSFTQEGGGTDHDDLFYYWVNQQTKRVDYLAYSYHVNNGGVRFRVAYNARKINGIYFQDYINYKADKNTALAELPKLYEAGKLKELSRIELEHIRRLER